MAMLDGTQLVAMLLVWLGVLLPASPHSSPDRPPAPGLRSGGNPITGGLLAGAGGSALLLLKAPVALPVLMVALALRWLDRDLNRRAWAWLLIGLLLGLLPGVAWHLWHGWSRGAGALILWTSQGFARVGTTLESHARGPLPPIREVVRGGWPWLTLWPAGMALAWRQRRERWGRWCCGLTLFVSLLVLPLRTQLPHYSLLLWPPFALVCGPVLAWIVRRQEAAGPPPPMADALERLALLWSVAGLLLIGGVTAWALDVGMPSPLPWIGVSAGSGLLVGGRWLQSPRPGRRRQGAVTLVAGLWLCLLLLFSSKLWLWELNEHWAVRPVADRLRPLAAGSLYLWQRDERPSLHWYVGRRLRRADGPEDLIPDANGEVWLLSGETPAADPYRCEGMEPAVHRCRRGPPGGAAP
jgi:hypothetical protein